AWLGSFAVLSTAAGQVGLAYHINNSVLWTIFGVPADLYGFRNLVLPELISTIIVATPCTLSGLSAFMFLWSSWPRWSIKNCAICGGCIVAGLAIVITTSIVASRQQVHSPGPALVLFLTTV